MHKRKAAATLWLTGALLFRSSVAHAALPPPWQSADVGNVGAAGSAYQGPDGDLFFAGAGSDIWGTADSFQFVYVPILDGRISAHIGDEENTSPYAKIGVMIRQSLDPSAPEVILDIKPDGGVEFMTRQTQGGETTFLAGSSVPATPVGSGSTVAFYATLQLVRSNGRVAGLVCAGSSTCQTIGTAAFADGAALIGVAITSHAPTTLNHGMLPADVPAVSTVPDPWRNGDLGSVGVRGSAFFQHDTFTVNGAGADIWGTADAYQGVSQVLNGDGSVSARVLSEDATNPFAKAGVIIEANSSLPAVILDVRPTGDIEFMARATQGADMVFVAGASASFPVWLKLQRSDDQITGLMSQDGQTWQTVGTTTVAFGLNVPAGLAVTSHDTTVLNKALFDNVVFTTQGFLNFDIGDVGANGSTSFSGGVYTVQGAGATSGERPTPSATSRTPSAATRP